ncbi:MAG: hypothetical protein R8J85_09295, partial [Mariprofundales bacterium]
MHNIALSSDDTLSTKLASEQRSFRMPSIWWLLPVAIIIPMQSAMISPHTINTNMALLTLIATATLALLLQQAIKYLRATVRDQALDKKGCVEHAESDSINSKAPATSEPDDVDYASKWQQIVEQTPTVAGKEPSDAQFSSQWKEIVAQAQLGVATNTPSAESLQELQKINCILMEQLNDVIQTTDTAAAGILTNIDQVITISKAADCTVNNAIAKSDQCQDQGQDTISTVEQSLQNLEDYVGRRNSECDAQKASIHTIIQDTESLTALTQ